MNSEINNKLIKLSKVKLKNIKQKITKNIKNFNQNNNFILLKMFT